MSISAIVFGASGMVGEGVLHECLGHPDVTSVLVIGRRPSGTQHQKMKELIHRDFMNYVPIRDQLKGYDACFFCMGTTSIGKNEQDYTHITYDLTMQAARALSDLNPDMTFCYVSGMGTDSSERGRSMWARVKGRTENDLTKLPFKAVYLFRPGFIQPIRGLQHTLSFAKIASPLFPLMRLLIPSYVCTLHDVGQAMIRVARTGYPERILECRQITGAANADQ